MVLGLKYRVPTESVCSLLSPEHRNYYHYRNPRSPYDKDRSPVWYVQKLCQPYCEPVHHPPIFALGVHGIRRIKRFNAFALL